jgi:hypothetical protein
MQRLLGVVAKYQNLLTKLRKLQNLPEVRSPLPQFQMEALRFVEVGHRCNEASFIRCFANLKPS